MSLDIALVGASGRMGVAIEKVAKEMDVFVAQAPGRKADLEVAFSQVQVVVDFSLAPVTNAVVDAAIATKRPLVIGTTGHDPATRDALRAKCAAVPTVWAGNFSIGVNLLFALTRIATETLGAEFDTEVVEMHHRLKKDAPSGTAERLLEIILAARKLDRTSLRHGREGVIGERPTDEIGVHALRGGEVVGEHTVMYAGAGERLELTHKASDRAIFARGALQAAHWLMHQPPGLYDMEDVLGLRS